VLLYSKMLLNNVTLCLKIVLSLHLQLSKPWIMSEYCEVQSFGLKILFGL
jgi:hypothetical protein